MNPSNLPIPTPPIPTPVPGQKSTEFWLCAGTILVVMIVATILLLTGVLKEDNWTKIILYVCGIMGPAYTASRTLVKRARP